MLIFSCFNSPRHSGFDVGNNNNFRTNHIKQVAVEKWKWERNNVVYFVTSWKKINTTPSLKTSILSFFTVKMPEHSWPKHNSVCVVGSHCLWLLSDALPTFFFFFFLGSLRPSVTFQRAVKWNHKRKLVLLKHRGVPLACPVSVHLPPHIKLWRRKNSQGSVNDARNI